MTSRYLYWHERNWISDPSPLGWKACKKKVQIVVDFIAVKITYQEYNLLNIKPNENLKKIIQKMLLTIVTKHNLLIIKQHGITMQIWFEIWSVVSWNIICGKLKYNLL